jgi:hypothetical protein
MLTLSKFIIVSGWVGRIKGSIAFCDNNFVIVITNTEIKIAIFFITVIPIFL